MPKLFSQRLPAPPLSFGQRAAKAWGSIKAALPMAGWGGGARYGASWFYGLLPGARIDYRRLAGQPWKNSIVLAAIKWIGRNLAQAPWCVFEADPDGSERIVAQHPLTKLLARPNKFYSGRVLRFATMLSLIVDGNAYWYIVRDMTGKPKEFWYLPHTQVSPSWPVDATTDNWITKYVYWQQGQQIDLRFEDVIHFRDGLDPDNLRLGMSDLASAWRELVTDNEASGYSAAIMKNCGVPGAIITPADANKTFSKGTKDELKEEYEDSTQGDNRGRPMVLSGPIKVEKLALSPEELLLSTIQNKPEERICALIGLSPTVLNLGVGLAKSTYNNKESDREAAWYECIIPRLDIINSEIDVQVLAFFGSPDNQRVGCDYSNVRALRESQDNLYARITDAVGGPWLSANEGRAQVGLKAVEGYDEIYPPQGAAQVDDKQAKSAANNGNDQDDEDEEESTDKSDAVKAWRRRVRARRLAAERAGV